jgi:MYXO-CTERM domain-containing protein
VLLYDTSNLSHVREGAIAAGCSITSTSRLNFTSTLIDGTNWQIVAMDFPSSSPVGEWQGAVIEHVRSGGRLLMSYWQMDDHPELAENLLVDVAESLTSMPTGYEWEPEHPLFNTPQRLRMPEVWGNEWSDNGDRYEPRTGATALAGLTPSASIGQAIVVIGYEGRVIVNGFMFDDFQGDLNGNDVEDGIDFAQNQFTFLAPVIGANCGDDVLDVGEECDQGLVNGTTPCGCLVDCTLRDAGVVCSIETACTAADTCDGDGNCTDGGFVADGTVCEESSGSTCVEASTCASGSCLGGDRLAPGTVCGDSDETCAQRDTCDADGICVDGGFTSAGVACGSANEGPCDQADQCDGAGFCDSRVLPAGTTCGDAGSECRSADVCSDDGTCAIGSALVVGTPCGDSSASACDEADSCSGTGICRPNPQSVGTPCENGAYCDGDDLCAGGICRSSGSPCAAGTTCDPSIGSCVEGAPTCGDFLVEFGEDCDDGDRLSGDGCSPDCVVEGGYDCSALAPDGSSDCVGVCGDGQVLGEETCDDGNEVDGDGCTDCMVLPGWSCIGEPSVCSEVSSICGNGRIESGEACDDGNELNEDGCGDGCTVEDGFTCFGEPSICEESAGPECGNGQVEPDESCDDNNGVSGDGCDTDCSAEDGWSCEGSPSVCILETNPDAGPDASGDIDAGPDAPEDTAAGPDAPDDADAEPGDVIAEPDSAGRDVVLADGADGTRSDAASRDSGSSSNERDFRGSGACATGDVPGGPWLLMGLTMLGLRHRRNG